MLILGVLLIISGFIYDVFLAGIPYQDPTLEMTQKYNFHRSMANTIELIGLAGVIIGIIGSILKKLSKIKIYNHLQ